MIDQAMICAHILWNQAYKPTGHPKMKRKKFHEQVVDGLLQRCVDEGFMFLAHLASQDQQENRRSGERSSSPATVWTS